MSRLIYAVYGSNLLKERFLYYIKGGYYKGRNYEGSTDKTDPIDKGWMFVPYRLYFAKRSQRWDNKGIAFLSCSKEEDENFHAVVRLWEISEKQFNDIWKQEGKFWYNKKLYLGKKDGLEIYTLTGCHTDKINDPSQSYIEVIKRGLKETTHWDDEKIEKYIEKFLGGF